MTEEYFSDQLHTPQLLFENPTLPTSGNTFTTVRIGDKWLSQNVAIGDALYFFRVLDGGGPGEEFGKGVLIGRFEGNIDAIPPTLLALNHDSMARTLPSLVGVLSEVYGAERVANALTGDMPVVTLFIRVEELAS